MRTRIVTFVLGAALLGCGGSGTATSDGPSGSSGESGEGTLGQGETGGKPTGGETGSSGEPTSSTSTTGAVESTGTSTSASDGDDGGCNFLCMPDFGGCDGGCLECDVWVQDCPQGQKCTAWAGDGGNAWNATKCVEVTGDGAPGEPCMTVGGGASGVDDCARGVMCWDVQANDMGTCVGLCTGSPVSPKCPGKILCSQFGDSVLNLCLPHCDPLVQDCPGDDLCIPFDDTFICALDDSRDGGQAHDPCEFANACDKGLACLAPAADGSSACDPAANGCCEPFCKFPDGACPAPDQQCVQWFDAATLPMDDPDLEIGVCRIPK